ncbi:uncharacterized protein LOC134832619 [Culicoides brevitarsis]|uniref:uncharacterized protein LOC134832619 n=1 Tax=Culicoides brevitarsis TaxID=469753 RepID=UPI00307C3C0F
MATPDREWDPDESLTSLQSTLEEMLIRLEEVESVMIATKQSTSHAKENIDAILSKKDQIYKMCKKIDDLEYFIDIVENNLSALTKQVETAEKELGISDNRIASLLKNVLFRTKSTQKEEQQGTNQPFVPIEVFRTEDFFKNSENQ